MENFQIRFYGRLKYITKRIKIVFNIGFSSKKYFHSILHLFSSFHSHFSPLFLRNFTFHIGANLSTPDTLKKFMWIFLYKTHQKSPFHIFHAPYCYYCLIFIYIILFYNKTPKVSLFDLQFSPTPF